MEQTADRCLPTRAWIKLSSNRPCHQPRPAPKSMLSSRIDETADKLAVFLLHHIHNTSPRHSRRRRYHNTLDTLRPTLNRRRSLAHTNHRNRKVTNSRDSRRVNTTLMRHMRRCTPNRNRTSRTMPRRMMMATTAMVECPCPRHTKPSAGISNSETTNARSMEPNSEPRQGNLSQQNNATVSQPHMDRRLLHGGDCAFGLHVCVHASARRCPVRSALSPSRSAESRPVCCTARPRC